MTSILKVDTIQDTDGNNIINESGNTITIGASGDTTNIVGTLQNNGAAVGGTNTPAFMATLSSDFTCPDQATTRVQFDTETYDIGNCFDSTSTVGRFTVPTGEGGKYFFSAQLMIAASGSVVHRSDTMLYKNGSEVAVNTGFDSNNTQFNVFAHINIPLVLSAGDYIDVYNYNDVSSGTPSARKGSYGNKSFFSGYKIIE
jgi:hypothetical protein